ncbi:type IV pilin protein [Agromyces mariniharenae]|uniref:Type II secretion system protein n=1 Tax=Agromyces mariniharenae TaxID=2604423 RepID=A0A5S4UVW5_9MICO|nr:type II secretion system protein [Agromyces mariniharenae]TYL51184.1 type II secretion system protein [Agromyces mariniharenae]
MARRASRTNHSKLQYQPLRGADFERHRSTVSLGDDVRSLGRGFTIVELLIVIVVIAILATITVVAYNGIKDRAAASAASSAAQQVAKKVMAYAITNADSYPATLSDAGVTDSGSTSYQYRVDNSTNPKTFCLTATSSNESYFASNSMTTPVAGGCAGHAVNGVIPTITNLAMSPKGSVSLAGWATSTLATMSFNASGGPTGGAFVQSSKSGTSSPFVLEYGLVGSPVHVPVTAGTTYTSSFYGSVTMATPQPFGIITRFYDAAGVQTDSNTVSGYVTPTNGNWARWSRTDVAPTGSTKARVVFYGPNGAVAGDVIRMSNVMVTAGSLLENYADGSSSGWTWNGTANNSTSTGPPL